ncbi:hypothetical protein AX17_006978 [Amanita inopinata Kibby_2008]|nr:hypothetical protein AX17_006978 [Amanita inopinata Kibby_2008]
MQLYLAVLGQTTDQAKEITVLTRMADGPGAHWARNRTMSILKGENIVWADFMKELEERFAHATSAHQARAEIHTLTQKGQIDQFLDHFKELKERSGIGKEAAMFLLERNIKGNIMKGLYG